ncbi:MAG TPA: LytTR family DNA-binding domain-containing protein [Bacteroidales bacterium]
MKDPGIAPAPVLEVKIDKGNKLINTAEVIYFGGNGKHVVMHFKDGNELDTHQLVKWYEEQLPEPMFCRCHDSFIVNCSYIECICSNKFILKGDIYIKISQKYRDHALSMYELYVRLGNGN